MGGAKELARLFVRDPTALGLVFANLYVGVAALGSDRMLRIVLLSYCAELIIIALYTVAKLIRVSPLGGALLAPLFLIPYVFLGAMILTVVFFIAGQQERAQLLGLRRDPAELVLEVARPAVLLFISHGVSFLQNFVARREYLQQELPELIEDSYLRLTWVWFAVLPIGILVAVFEAPGFGVLLVVVKLGLDLHSHFKQHGVLAMEPGEHSPPPPSGLLRWAGPILVGLAALTVTTWGPPVDAAAQALVRAHRDRRTVPLEQQRCADGDYFNCSRGCELGYPHSCHVLAFMYEQGMGVEKNLTRAAGLYQLACDQGQPDACYNLANMIRARGNATAGQLLPLYERSCQGGRGQACSTLGNVYAVGTWGQPRDESRARAYYQRACDLGDEWVGCSNAAKESLP